MTADDFAAWLARMGYSNREAARVLGMSKNTIGSYLKKGAPLSVGYACAALAHGLPPWKDAEWK